MSLRDNTERHLFYKDIYKHRGYAYRCAYAYAQTLDIILRLLAMAELKRAWLCSFGLSQTFRALATESYE